MQKTLRGAPELPENLKRAVAIQKIHDIPKLPPANSEHVEEIVLQQPSFWTWAEREQISLELLKLYPKSEVAKEWATWDYDTRQRVAIILLQARK